MRRVIKSLTKAAAEFCAGAVSLLFLCCYIFPVFFSSFLEENSKNREKMDSQEIGGNNICRFCLRKVKIFSQIVEKSQDEVQDAVSNLNSILNLNVRNFYRFSQFSWLFLITFGLPQIQEDDNWPKQICLPCKKQSGNCVRFYRKIKESEKKLLEIYGQRAHEESLEEVSVGVESLKGEVLDKNDFGRASSDESGEELATKSQKCVERVGKPKRSTRKLKEDTESKLMAKIKGLGG